MTSGRFPTGGLRKAMTFGHDAFHDKPIPERIEGMKREHMATGAPSTPVLTLKAEFSDSDGFITDADIAALPVFQVLCDSRDGVANDVTADAIPAGQAVRGNQFVFTYDGKRKFGLPPIS